jgi:hypothetical protein
MSTQVLEQVEVVELQPLVRRISALPSNSLLKLADYVEELIEELEDEEDIADIEARKDEPSVPFEEVIAEIEAEFGPLDDYED